MCGVLTVTCQLSVTLTVLTAGAGMAGAGAQAGPATPSLTVQPSLFDMFYEEFLTQFMSAADPNEISQGKMHKHHWPNK